MKEEGEELTLLIPNADMDTLVRRELLRKGTEPTSAIPSARTDKSKEAVETIGGAALKWPALCKIGGVPTRAESKTEADKRIRIIPPSATDEPSLVTDRKDKLLPKSFESTNRGENLKWHNLVNAVWY